MVNIPTRRRGFPAPIPITIKIFPAHLTWLQAQAKATGKDVSSLLGQLISEAKDKAKL